MNDKIEKVTILTSSEVFISRSGMVAYLELLGYKFDGRLWRSADGHHGTCVEVLQETLNNLAWHFGKTTGEIYVEIMSVGRSL